jgi:hypothetical protein
MRHVNLIQRATIAFALSALLGCVSAPQTEFSGVVIDKEWGPEGTNDYGSGNGQYAIHRPEAFWLLVRNSRGKVHTLFMHTPENIQAWHQVEVGDHWPPG